LQMSLISLPTNYFMYDYNTMPHNRGVFCLWNNG